jgi:large exoprotein involved in heme utilization and adhesion
LIVQDGASVSVSSLGTGNAGTIAIKANSLRLDNQGEITAETVSGNGGNMLLQVQDLLLLRHNSRIATTAGTPVAGGNGGNFNLNAQFLVAVPSENSDITTNAFTGEGGSINVVAQGIFGTQFREELTSKSDIVAIGKAVLDFEPDDPTQGIVTSSVELVDASNQIATACAAAGGNKFIITGRGGLPPSPNEPLSGEAVLTEWATLEPKVDNHPSAAPAPSSTKVSTPTPIMEANGWEINNKGEIILTANASSLPPNSPAFCTSS